MAADAITDIVADRAARFGWMVHHDRPARTAKGWRSALLGHQGFPDLVLVHPQHGIIFAECKGATGYPDVYQRLWRDTLAAAIGSAAGRVRYYLWRPAQLADGSIERILRGGA